MFNALLVVDAQKDFCEGGPLPVTGGVAVCDRIWQRMFNCEYDFTYIIASLDWHLDGPNNGHFDDWPAHCKMGSDGAKFQEPLAEEYFDEIFYKGRGVAAYTAFSGVGDYTGLTLEEYLSQRKVSTLSVCGLATDYCVSKTVLDALDRGIKVEVLSDLTEAVGDKAEALQILAAAGAVII